MDGPNTTSGTFDYLYTRIVELMTCVNDLEEMATKVCFQPRPTPDGLRTLPEPQFKLPATVKAVRKLNMFENWRKICSPHVFTNLLTNQIILTKKLNLDITPTEEEKALLPVPDLSMNAEIYNMHDNEQSYDYYK